MVYGFSISVVQQLGGAPTSINEYCIMQVIDLLKVHCNIGCVHESELLKTYSTLSYT